jgi:hypothetical protein
MLTNLIECSRRKDPMLLMLHLLGRAGDVEVSQERWTVYRTQDSSNSTRQT